MLMAFDCAKCGVELEVDFASAGSEIACPQCGTTLTVPKRRIGPRTTIGGFRIDRLLAQGGMGELYLAHQLSLDRPVALKVLPVQMTLNSEFVARFLNEGRLLARLEHPNIVQAYEAGEDGGVLFLAMAYVKGESLEHRIAHKGPLPEREALTIAKKLGQALAYAWNEQRMTHRDIKPANVQMDAKGEPRLLDFGLAKSMVEQATMTQAGYMWGSPNYMSLEQQEGREDLDFRSDMYSLGATLYHMLTGKIPFEGATVADTIRQGSLETLPDPRKFKPELSEPCVRLLELMLARAPENRHDSWEELGDDIQRALSRTLPAKPPPAANQSAMKRGLATVRGAVRPGPTAPKAPVTRLQPVSSHPVFDVKAPVDKGWSRVLALAALIGVALLGGVTVLVVRYQRAEANRREAERQRVVQEQAAAEGRLEAVKKTYSSAVEYVEKHPDDYAEGLAALERARQATAGTEYEAQAAERIQRLTAERQRQMGAAQTALVARVQQQVAAGQLAAAMEFLEKYDGPYPAETAAKRAELLQLCRQKADAEAQRKSAQVAQEQAEAQKQLAVVLDETAHCLVKGDKTAALQRICGAGTNACLAVVSNDLHEAESCLRNALAVPDALLASLARDKDKEVTVEFTTLGSRTVRVLGVEGRRVKVRETVSGVAVDRSIPVEDVSVRERLKRLGMEKTAVAAAMRGLVACEVGAWELAEREFAAGANPLCGALARAAGEVRDARAAGRLDQKKAAVEAAAPRAYSDLLKSVSAEVAVIKDSDAAATAIRERKVGEAQVKAIQKHLAEFEQAYGSTEFATEHAVVLDALREVGQDQPLGTDARTLERVKAQLTKDNPGEPIVCVMDADKEGLVVALSKNPKLVSISALARLPIVSLDLYETGVTSLAPLKGMPMRRLRIHSSPISDLKPLQGMPLEELDLSMTRAVDIRSLHGMPLKKLKLNGNYTDLTPLEGLPLNELWLGWNYQLKDLEGLKGLPLKKLRMQYVVLVADLTPLRGMKLTNLEIIDCQAITDIAPLRGMPLTNLGLKGTKVTDLTPVKGTVGLTVLDWRGNTVTP